MPPNSDIKAEIEIKADTEVAPGEVWSTIEEQMRQEVVNEFRRIVKEMIDEQFRFDTAATPTASRRNLRATVEPLSGVDQQGEPANAVRAA